MAADPAPHDRRKIYFAGDAERRVVPLAEACGVGTHGPDRDNRFVRLNQWAAQHLQAAATMDDADVVVWINGHDGSAEINETSRSAQALGKPFVVFRSSDDLTPVTLPHGTVWRDSILKSQMTASERSMPAYAIDTGNQPTQPYTLRPRVAFRGFVGSAWQRLLYKVTGRKEKVAGLSLRESALRHLERATDIDTDFQRRTSFGGADLNVDDEAQRQRLRQNYIDNVLGSPYTFCTRGAGNFSFRLYEVFSMGRIPLFLDSDAVLPFEDEIDYARHMPIAQRVDELPHVLLEWHRQHDAESFEAVQRANRQLWLDYFEPAAFFRRVIESAVRK